MRSTRFVVSFPGLAVWRRFFVGAAAFAFLVALAPRSFADGDLTLELPPSPELQEIRASAAKSQRKSGPIARTSVAPKGRRGSLPSRKGGRGFEVGKLGVVEQAVPVYRTANRNGRELTRIEPGTYVAIQDENETAFGILMADGSTGWVDKNRITPLAVQVVAPDGSLVPSDGQDTFARQNTVWFNGDADELIKEAYKYLGVRYVWGGNTMRGIDCSGFVKNVFGARGYPLPRLGSDQMAYGISVPKDQLQKGDRLYFGRRRDGRTVTHTGLYIGNGYFIHASSSRKGVAVSHLTEPLFQRIYACARR